QPPLQGRTAARGGRDRSDQSGRAGRYPARPTRLAAARTSQPRSRTRAPAAAPHCENTAEGGAMTSRRRLPARRASITFTFDCGPHKYIATTSYFPNGELAEIFLGNGRAGSDVDAAAKDSAVLASIGLQYEIPLDVLRKALLRDVHGMASSP